MFVGFIWLIGFCFVLLCFMFCEDVLYTYSVLPLLIFIATLEGRCYYHPHFTDVNMEADWGKETNQGHKASRWRAEVLTWGSPFADHMPSIPLSSGGQASSHSWSPIWAWDSSLKSTPLCRRQAPRVPLLVENRGSYKRSDQVNRCSAAATLPWV